MDIEDVRRLLARAVGDNQKAWAEQHGISPKYVNDVMNGYRHPGKKILDALNLEAVRHYRWKVPPAN